MDLKAVPRKILVFGLLLIILLASAFYFVLGRGAKSNTTKQLLSQEQTVARAEATNITSFFQAFGNSVTTLAQANSPRDLGAFVEQWRSSGIVAGVVVTDKNGIVLSNANIMGIRDVGGNLSDRDYFSWAKDQPKSRQYYIGTAVVSRMGASKGQVIVPVASPIFKNGQFNGVIAAAVELKPLTNHYLELMKISSSTDVYLIDSKGNLLYNGPSPEMVGVNVFESLESKPFLGSKELIGKIKDLLSKAQEGNLQAAYLDSKSGRIKQHLVAYSPIQLGNQSWLLVLSSPIETVTDATKPIYIRQISILALIFLSSILFEFLVIRESQKRSSE